LANPTKVRALKRKNVFIPEPEIQHLTIDEMFKVLGDPYDGQHARYGHGKEQVDRLWTPDALALEIHDSPQATMMAKFNLEYAEDEAGKKVRTGGNRSQLALRILKERYGVDDVEVVIESETPEGRPLKLTHVKNYGVKFPVKFYGKLSPDQLVELEDRDDRAVKKSSKADFFFKGWQALKTTTISLQPSKEKMLVKRLGVGNVNAFFPQKRGFKKDGTPYLPAVSVDEKTGDITINNREAIQTCFRMFELPDAVALAVVASEAGEGPKIPLRTLSSKLIPAWEDDKSKAKGRLNNSMSIDEIKSVLPTSSLVANMEAVTATKSKGSKKITPYTGAEMKKLEGLCGGSALLVNFLKVLQREPSHAKDVVLTSIIEATTAAEKALGASHEKMSAVFAAIQSSEEPVSDEDEEVDPETGEPLSSDE
jgi:hypothetical protein